jgi:hypothetical protein
MLEIGLEKHQQLQQQLKPKRKLQLKLQPKAQHEPKLKSAPIRPRRWETVQWRAHCQRAPVGLGPYPGPDPAPATQSSMAQKPLILLRDVSVPLLNKMDQEIASAINRASFHQNSQADIQIMNATRNARRAITAITHQNAKAAMALMYCDVIITLARTADRGVIDVQEKESWEWPKIHAVPLVRCMGKGIEGLQNMQHKIYTENEGVEVPVQVQQLASPHSIQERLQKGKISAASVVFIVKGTMVARSLVKEAIKAAGVWYRVEQFTNAGPDSRCEHGCG